MLLSRHELCRIYALFWSDFDADFYADIEDFVQILCRFLHEKMLGGTSALRSFFCDFFQGVHLTLDCDNMYSETDFTPEIQYM